MRSESLLRMIPINDLSRSVGDQREVLEAIDRVVRSGQWILGPEHSAFERELADFIGTKHALGVANGTDALEIALRAAGCAPGAKVITVANAGGYTSIAATAIGCEIIYCDIDSERLVMDPQSLRDLLSYDIKVVIVTHLYGNVAPVSNIVEMCKSYGITVVEDCAQAIGASASGRPVGSIGDIGTFSFFPTKNLGAIGDAGAITTNNPTYAENIRSLRQYGWADKYKVERAGGMNSRLDEIQASILRVKFRGLLENNDKRRKILAEYSGAVKNSDLKLITSYSKNSAAHLAVILLPEENIREEFRNFFKDKGISTDIHYPILDYDQKKFNKNAELANSKSISGRIVTIPLFPNLMQAEVGLIKNALCAFISEELDG
jgi:aminotransferase EvaB